MPRCGSWKEFGIEFLDAQARERAVAKGRSWSSRTQRLRFDRNLVANMSARRPPSSCSMRGCRSGT